jgi:hypothetical protein
MTDNKKDDPGKGPVWPGDRRPHATIDVQATKVDSQDKGKPAAGGARPEASAQTPPQAGKPATERTFAARVAAARDLPRRAAQSNAFLSHLVAGVAGAVLTLIAAALFGLFPTSDGGGQQAAPDLTKRLAALEAAMHQGPTSTAGDVAARLATTDNRLKSLEDQARTIAALAQGQAKLATETKALEGRAGSPELADRLAKVEAALADASAGDLSAHGPQAAALAGKLAELEKLATEATEAAKSAASRADSELALVRADASRLGQRFDALKGDVEARLRGAAKSAELAPVLTKLAAFEQDLQRFLKGEGERTSNAQRVLLTLEIANLKRAMDRGDRYAAELDAVRKVAGTTLNLAPLQRYSLEGVPTLLALTKEFRGVANAAIDADAEPADASVWERLLAGARSIVRVRKTGHKSDDMSAEAVVGRMETALKEGRVGEVLANGAKLPPKASLAAEGWLQKLQARHLVDQSIAEIEAALKSSLAARSEPGTELER